MQGAQGLGSPKGNSEAPVHAGGLPQHGLHLGSGGFMPTSRLVPGVGQGPPLPHLFVQQGSIGGNCGWQGGGHSRRPRHGGPPHPAPGVDRAPGDPYSEGRFFRGIASITPLLPPPLHVGQPLDDDLPPPPPLLLLLPPLAPPPPPWIKSTCFLNSMGLVKGAVLKQGPQGPGQGIGTQHGPEGPHGIGQGILVNLFAFLSFVLVNFFFKNFLGNFNIFLFFYFNFSYHFEFVILNDRGI